MKRYHDTINKRSRLIDAPVIGSNGSTAALAAFDPKALKHRIASALRIQNDYFPCFDWTFPPPITPKSRAPVNAMTLFSEPTVVCGRYSIYAHVPFCASLCRFCYYPVIPGSHEDEMQRYVDYLLREMAAYAPALEHSRCESVYIGGGTPTYLGDRLLQRLLDGIHRNFRFTEDAEVSIESAPGTIPRDRLALLLGLGVNRVSYGIQSLDSAMLAGLNRDYSVPAAIAEISQAVEIIGNVNVDTMYGFEGEADGALAGTLTQLIGLGVPGLSIYSLDSQRCDHDRVRFLPARDEHHERKLAIFRHARQLLDQEGFEPVLQNIFIRPGRASFRHQLRRWENVPLVALGISSMGYAPRVLYQNHIGLKNYYRSLDEGQLPVLETERITPELEMARELVSQLRFTAVNVRHIDEKYGVDVQATYRDLISALSELGYLEVHKGTLRLAEDAAAYNNIIPMLFAPDAFKQALFDLPEEYREQFPLPFVLTQVGATQNRPIGI
ncbi:MAG: coproporphyrinogen-III oxidase family protein [Gammaproteobacteria bacterium]|nr:coproporphyrinogen-III oxidase family protein [Gammaproteobacteria bacterium]